MKYTLKVIPDNFCSESKNSSSRKTGLSPIITHAFELIESGHKILFIRLSNNMNGENLHPDQNYLGRSNFILNPLPELILHHNGDVFHPIEDDFYFDYSEDRIIIDKDNMNPLSDTYQQTTYLKSSKVTSAIYNFLLKNDVSYFANPIESESKILSFLKKYVFSEKIVIKEIIYDLSKYNGLETFILYLKPIVSFSKYDYCFLLGMDEFIEWDINFNYGGLDFLNGGPYFNGFELGWELPNTSHIKDFYRKMQIDWLNKSVSCISQFNKEYGTTFIFRHISK